MPPKRADVEPLDISGVADEWDGCDDVRDRLRNGQYILGSEAVQDDVQGCCSCSSLLVPILTRMSLRDGKPLPPIDELRAEMEKVYAKNKRGVSPEDQDEIVKSSWGLKKMLGFAKMKCRREEVSTVTCPFCFEHFDLPVSFKHISHFNLFRPAIFQ